MSLSNVIKDYYDSTQMIGVTGVDLDMVLITDLVSSLNKVTNLEGLYLVNVGA